MTTRPQQLRAMMLERPDLFEAISLTKQQRATVLAVRGQNGSERLSHFIATELEVSVQAASNLLKKAHDKGYLTRRNIGDPTGGAQWAYSYALGGAV